MNRMTEPWTRFSQVQRQVLQGDGAFLASLGPDGRPNLMTIGWALLGTAWARPVLLVLVRPSRHTHGCILATGAFAVSVPFGKMKEELEFCGSRSGRNVDKFKALGISPIPGQYGPAPIIPGCDVAYECRVLARTPLVPDGLVTDEIRARYYPKGDLHTLFFGEVLAAWKL